jgi:WD40 repeat protein
VVNGSGGGSSSVGNAAQSCRYFLTASNIGNVRVWDAQDVLQPLHERVVSRNAINAALWMGPPHVFVVGSADGMLRQIWVDAGAQATTITTQVADGERHVYFCRQFLQPCVCVLLCCQEHIFMHNCTVGSGRLCADICLTQVH